MKFHENPLPPKRAGCAPVRNIMPNMKTTPFRKNFTIDLIRVLFLWVTPDTRRERGVHLTGQKS